MDVMDKTSEAKAAIAAQAELEEERKKRRRQEQLEQNNFIQSQITHAAKEEVRRREEELLEEERERQAEEDDSALQQEQEEKRRREAEEKADEEADAAIDMLGGISGDLGEAACRQLIDDLCAGRKPLRPEREAQPSVEKAKGEEAANDAPEQGEEMSIVEVKEIPRDVRAMMIGNTLRNFSRFVAGEAPLSNKHAEAGRLCANIMRRAAKQGITREEMGLNPEEWTAVQGTVQLGEIVKKGLEAKAALSNPAYSGINRAEHLRNYLVFRGVEQMMAPHAEKYGSDIQLGENLCSPAQILLGSPGFSAGDVSRMVGKSAAMSRLMSMTPAKVQELVSHGSAELDALGAKAMTACYDNGMQKAKEPKTQKHREVQKGGCLKK